MILYIGKQNNVLMAEQVINMLFTRLASQITHVRHLDQDWVIRICETHNVEHVRTISGSAGCTLSLEYGQLLKVVDFRGEWT